MELDVALAFMASVYASSHLGGGIPAILVNMPGDGGAAATTLDGYPMTLKGKGQQALVLCFVASTVGGLITSLATVALLPYLAPIGLYLRSVDMVVVMVLGLVLIAAIASDDLLKGLIAGFFGLMLGPSAPTTSIPRRAPPSAFSSSMTVSRSCRPDRPVRDRRDVLHARARDDRAEIRRRPCATALGRHVGRSAAQREVLVADGLDRVPRAC